VQKACREASTPPRDFVAINGAGMDQVYLTMRADPVLEVGLHSAFEKRRARAGEYGSVSHSGPAVGMTPPPVGGTLHRGASSVDVALDEAELGDRRVWASGQDGVRASPRHSTEGLGPSPPTSESGGGPKTSGLPTVRAISRSWEPVWRRGPRVW